jgi:hypothetical protein
VCRSVRRACSGAKLNATELWALGRPPLAIIVKAYDDPQEIERAKQAAAGPLGDQLSKYPLRFAAGVFIGPTRRSKIFRPNSGTATLIQLDRRPLAVTCSHVIDSYRERNPEVEAGFWIGNLQIDPLKRLVAEDARLDLAVIDLTGLDIKLIADGSEIGACFVDPTSWPPKRPAEGEFISFGGFPGVLRKHNGDEEVTFNSFSLGASEVTSVGDNYLVCQLNREYWVSSRGRLGFDLHELGGMSGGPAFMWRGVAAELAGFIYEYSPALDLVYIRSAHVINVDGTLAS